MAVEAASWEGLGPSWKRPRGSSQLLDGDVFLHLSYGETLHPLNIIKIPYGARARPVCYFAAFAEEGEQEGMPARWECGLFPVALLLCCSVALLVRCTF